MIQTLGDNIDELKKQVLELSAVVEESVYKATYALDTQNRKLAEDVLLREKIIDHTEIEIEAQCVRIIARHQPSSTNLRFIVTILKVNSELEQIGDLAANIAERVIHMILNRNASIPFNLDEIITKVRLMVKISLDALMGPNLELAKKTLFLEEEVDEMNETLYAEIKQHIQQNPQRLEIMLDLLSITSYLERIGDHAKKIAENVIFLLEGAVVRHQNFRPELVLRDVG
ncbi:phosphate signaling complex protein PhoU [Deltaproteobacteria bacterium TL4]